MSTKHRQNPESAENTDKRDADSWRVHVLGPDDLIPMDSELRALREANMLNIALARVRLKTPNDPNMPWCMAVAERNGVEYTEDQYP